jgi:hypothetical protein
MEKSRFNYPSQFGKNGEISHIVALAFDSHDGHSRLTTSDQFFIMGGSEDTHQKMTQVVLRTCESLERQGKSVSDATQEEIQKLLQRYSS